MPGVLETLVVSVRGTWRGIMLGAFANDVRLHADRTSRAVEIVIQAAPIEREYG